MIETTNQNYSFKKWKKTFRPINDIYMYETYGDEFAYVLKQDPLTIWTWVDGGNDSDDCYIINGLHYVNRLGHYITENPFKEDDNIYVKLPFEIDN